MDQFLQAQSNIPGSHSVNNGDHNIFGTEIPGSISNIYVLRNTPNFGVGNQGGEFGAGDTAARPYRLIPYGRNSTFTGRIDILESVKRFSESKGHNRVALYGLGGSGKTQIALEFVYQCASDSDCDVFWVQGSGLLKFSEDFRTIAQHVRVPLASTVTDEEDFLLSVRRWFEGSNSGDWILVIDNADNEADFLTNDSPIAKFIPRGTRGTLIFTTRSRQVASRQDCEMIEVGKMEMEEAEELFSKRLGSWDGSEEEEKEAIKMILDSLHHLPLAIVGSAAFMIETKTPPSVYWTILQENDERMKKLLSQQFRDIQRDSDMTKGVLGTYFVTFSRIEQQMPMAGNLLRLMAFFDRENIPEELLSQSGLGGTDDSIEFCQAIGKLLGFSLVTRVKSGKKTLYEVHRLVQLSLQVYLPKEDLNQGRATALQVISRLFPRDQSKRRCIGPAYIPHALAVTRDSTDPIAEELRFRMGQYFQEIGSYSNAEMQFRRCLELREEGKEYDWDDEGHLRLMHLGLVYTYQGKYDDSGTITRRALEGLQKILGPDHPNTLTSVNNLAILLRCRGKYNESEKMNRRALNGRKGVLGPDHPDTLGSVNNLAMVLRDQGKYEESETMNRLALEGRENFLGLDHPDTLGSVDNLAVVLRDQTKCDESERMNRRALEGREKILGPDHPDTLGSVDNLAVVLRDQAKYDESEKMNRRALEGYKKVLGPDHPATLTSVHNLAMVLRDQGKYDESEGMARRAHEGWEKVLGPDHPNTLTSLHNLAMVLQDRGMYDESEKMNRRALEGYEKALEADHPHILTSVNNLAAVLWKQRKYDESEAMNRRALEWREKVLGLRDPATLSNLDNLAIVLSDQGKYRESEAINRRALETREKVFGQDHPTTLRSVNNLAAVLGKQEKYEESEIMNRRAHEGYEQVLPPDHPDTLTCLNNLSVVLWKQGKYSESEMMNRRALRRRRKVLGPNHPATLTSVYNLAMVLWDQGKYAGSLAMNRRAHQGYERALGSNHPNTLTCLNNLSVVLRKQGKYNESEATNRCALEGRAEVHGLDHPDTLTSLTNLAAVLWDQRKYHEVVEVFLSAQERDATKPVWANMRFTGRLILRILKMALSSKIAGQAK